MTLAAETVERTDYRLARELTPAQLAAGPCLLVSLVAPIEEAPTQSERQQKQLTLYPSLIWLSWEKTSAAWGSLPKAHRGNASPWSVGKRPLPARTYTSSSGLITVSGPSPCWSLCECFDSESFFGSRLAAYLSMWSYTTFISSLHYLSSSLALTDVRKKLMIHNNVGTVSRTDPAHGATILTYIIRPDWGAPEISFSLLFLPKHQEIRISGASKIVAGIRKRCKRSRSWQYVSTGRKRRRNVYCSLYVCAMDRSNIYAKRPCKLWMKYPHRLRT